MPDYSDEAPRRLLVIDDNRAIHDDFRKIFESSSVPRGELAATEAALFGDGAEPAVDVHFRLDCASQGAEGVALVAAARGEYALAFIDMRMPPGLDGIETTSRIWELDPAVQVVICTAYSDHSWDDVRRRFGHTDRLLILKKPFDNIEVLQLASALTEKWRLAGITRRRLQELETLLEQRAAELRALQARVSQVAA
jgi:CheY-like chemotaxis protein